MRLQLIAVASREAGLREASYNAASYRIEKYSGRASKGARPYFY